MLALEESIDRRCADDIPSVLMAYRSHNSMVTKQSIELACRIRHLGGSVIDARLGTPAMGSTITIDLSTRLDGVRPLHETPPQTDPVDFVVWQARHVVDKRWDREQNTRPMVCEVAKRSTASVIFTDDLTDDQLVTLAAFSPIHSVAVVGWDAIGKTTRSSATWKRTLTQVQAVVLDARSVATIGGSKKVESAMGTVANMTRGGVVIVVDQDRVRYQVRGQVRSCRRYEDVDRSSNDLGLMAVTVAMGLVRGFDASRCVAAATAMSADPTIRNLDDAVAMVAAGSDFDERGPDAGWTDHLALTASTLFSLGASIISGGGR